MTDHFNDLTPAEAERLALLMEECGEVVHACAKVLRHGYGSRHPVTDEGNREAVEKEIGDVLAVVQLMEKAGDVSGLRYYRQEKLKNVSAYLHHQEGSAHD